MQRWISILLAIIIVGIVGYVLIAPIGPLPGVRIGGQAATPPGQWSSIDLPGEILLQADTGNLPRVVTIWVVEHNNELYVSGMKESGWVEAAERSPQVQVRIGDDVYALNAELIDPIDPEVYHAYINRYKDDYPDIVAQIPAVDQIGEVGSIFRLARAGG